MRKPLLIIQKQFSDAHSTTVVHGVTDLDHDIDFGGDIESMTLRQVLLGMKQNKTALGLCLCQWILTPTEMRL